MRVARCVGRGAVSSASLSYCPKRKAKGKEGQGQKKGKEQGKCEGKSNCNGKGIGKIKG